MPTFAEDEHTQCETRPLLRSVWRPSPPQRIPLERTVMATTRDTKGVVYAQGRWSPGDFASGELPPTSYGYPWQLPFTWACPRSAPKWGLGHFSIPLKPQSGRPSRMQSSATLTGGRQQDDKIPTKAGNSERWGGGLSRACPMSSATSTTPQLTTTSAETPGIATNGLYTSRPHLN